MRGKFWLCVSALVHDAREIAKDDPEILTGDFDGFSRVMWSDDDDFKRWGFRRDTYEAALREAWKQCTPAKS